MIWKEISRKRVLDKDALKEEEKARKKKEKEEKKRKKGDEQEKPRLVRDRF